MEKQPDVKKRVEQFYRLLANHGLSGKAQPLSRQKQRDINKLFPE